MSNHKRKKERERCPRILEREIEELRFMSSRERTVDRRGEREERRAERVCEWDGVESFRERMRKEDKQNQNQNQKKKKTILIEK